MRPFFLAHGLAAAVGPRGVSREWSAEPAILIPLLAVAVAYIVGVRRLWRVAGVGRGISVRATGAFAGACAALVAALLSPLDHLSGVLLSAHMAQHELLILVAAPLAALSNALTALLWLLPPRTRKTVGRAIHHRPLTTMAALFTAPAAAFLLHGAALWIWHAPVLYQAALDNDLLHAFEHLCFFGTATLFWWGLTHGRYGRLGYGAAVVYVFATSMHSGVLGALLTLSPGLWYPAYAGTSVGWSLTPLEDQQLAGLTMWVPAGAIFVVAGLVFFAAWLRESERRVRYGTAVGSLAVLIVLGSVSCSSDVYRQASAMTGGDPTLGRSAIARYGCDTCHMIPGIATATGRVGPPLTAVAARVYLAGHVPNTPANMQAWIRRPHAYSPQTVMPETGVTESDGRDIAAYLFTLR